MFVTLFYSNLIRVIHYHVNWPVYRLYDLLVATWKTKLLCFNLLYYKTTLRMLTLRCSLTSRNFRYVTFDILFKRLIKCIYIHCIPFLWLQRSSYHVLKLLKFEMHSSSQLTSKLFAQTCALIIEMCMNVTKLCAERTNINLLSRFYQFYFDTEAHSVRLLNFKLCTVLLDCNKASR